MTVAVNTESPSLPKPLALIAGPTASGKSALALALAKLTPATIINADASQAYRDLRIVSARPNADEEAQAPHRLFGHIDGALAYSAAQWAVDAKIAIADAWTEGRLPVVVGGTGLYLRILIDGIAPVPTIDPAIRDQIRALDVRGSYALLAVEDPAAAQRLNPNDTTRIARALEVIRSTGKPIADWQADRVGGIGGMVKLAPMVLLPPRDWLFARCDARFSRMINCGACSEIEALLARCLDPALPVMRAIGVREIAAMIADPAQRANYVAMGQLATRQYAKRQYTWFRNQCPPDWPRISAQLDDEIINDLVIKLRNMVLTD
jgi:tRNA dimethylallyltransferase